ncbi:MAG: DUF424 family protein [archaeon]
MFVKIHNAYRRIVAVCDAELIGKKLEQGNMQLELSEEFYKGEKRTEKEVLEIMKIESSEDAVFNIAGKKAVQAGLKAGIIGSTGIIQIDGVPYALTLL